MVELGSRFIVCRPFVVVVTGCPSSGKTTLAHRLASQVHCSVLCRDEFKEGYVHTTGGSHESLGKDVNRHLYTLFFETVDFIVSKGISVVIEAAFQHKLWEPKLAPLTEIADVRIIICVVDPHVADARFIQRRSADPERMRFHGDKGVQMVKEGCHFSEYMPPKLEVPTMRVETTDGYDPCLERIVEFMV